MFKSKRNALIKALWRSRVVEKESAIEETLYQACKCLFKRLKKNKDLEDLRELVVAARDGGEESSGPCFFADCDEIETQAGRLSPEVLTCRVWRWVDVDERSRLKSRPCCERKSRKSDDGLVCINPYHYSRIDREDDAVASLSDAGLRISTCQLSVGEKSDDCTCSTTFTVSSVTAESETSPMRTLSEYVQSLGRGTRNWCNIAYWELMQRVGRMYNATSECVDIYAESALANGLCIGPLTNDKRSDAIKRVRDHIGRGIQISCEDDGVWIYNQSDYPIFAQSPTLDYMSKGRLPAVKKVQPGYSTRVFDFERCREMLECEKTPQSGNIPDDPFSFRVSFAKGWGPSYTRQYPSSCPCWIEVFLNVTR